MNKDTVDNPRFFPTPADFRVWLEKNHDKEDVLWVGFYKKATGIPSITWPESVDEALCFGWIDGLRKSHDDVSYRIRFTPRKPTSNWSAKNVARVEELIAEGRMRPSGMRAYEARLEHKTAVYSFEQREDAAFDPAYDKRFKANTKAWTNFQSMPPGYIRTATFWVMSAKREETRERRLATLIEDSENERKVKPLRRPGE
ncbi:MAG TPA: YdeI/OmpD-associated family protein [Rhodothermia bacterium]|nr:YdeI/OmpD-associated family protein [Rhodothermia bacterium]